jgi:hypothetical protein
VREDAEAHQQFVDRFQPFARALLMRSWTRSRVCIAGEFRRSSAIASVRQRFSALGPTGTSIDAIRRSSASDRTASRIERARRGSDGVFSRCTVPGLPGSIQRRHLRPRA